MLNAVRNFRLLRLHFSFRFFRDKRWKFRLQHALQILNYFEYLFGELKGFGFANDLPSVNHFVTYFGNKRVWPEWAFLIKQVQELEGTKLPFRLSRYAFPGIFKHIRRKPLGPARDANVKLVGSF